MLLYRINHSLSLTDSVRSKVVELIDSMGISCKLNSMIHELSQGEQQRVAICRALLPAPNLLLADEPKGNLNPKNKARILDLLFEHAHKSKATLIILTHDMTLLDHFEKIIYFESFRQR
ncbi:MAG: ATP-binding cassette domain-containing protein [Thermodesulfobacteriota bacterium]|nr:ATP-binding cassette domain-containing protein [Thermodesulfobacteriota bacterium]